MKPSCKTCIHLKPKPKTDNTTKLGFCKRWFGQPIYKDSPACEDHKEK